jgi:hypothetical protein
MNEFNFEELESALNGALQENTARIAVNEIKEGNKVSVDKKKDVQLKRIKAINNIISENISELRKVKSSVRKVPKENMYVSEACELSLERMKLNFALQNISPDKTRAIEYVFLVGEHLINASNGNPEIAKLIENLGINLPK